MRGQLRKWTVEDREKAARLRRKGFSAKQIAVEVGRTRNAVIGLLWRAGVPARTGWL